MWGWSASSATSKTVYWPWVTLSLELELELSLDLPIDADELPSEVNDALDADDVLSANAGAEPRQNAITAASGRAGLRRCCMKVCLRNK
jgi:hypothetical protein